MAVATDLTNKMNTPGAGNQRNALATQQRKPLTTAGEPGTQLAPAVNKAGQLSIGVDGLQFQNLDELWRFCKIYASSGMAPKGVDTPEKICVAFQMGSELGLKFTTAVQNIAVINGRPSIWGDVGLALCQLSKYFDHEAFDETMKLDSKGDPTWTCTVKRIGAKKETVRIYAWSDAVRAGDSKKDTYQKYPKRMIQMRARWWALRDTFPDVLKGIGAAEEQAEFTPPPGRQAEITPTTVSGLLDKLRGEQTAVAEGGQVVDEATDDGGGLAPGEVVGEGGEIFQVEVPACCPAAVQAQAEGCYATNQDLEADLAGCQFQDDVDPIREFYTGSTSPLETAVDREVAQKICATKSASLPARQSESASREPGDEPAEKPTAEALAGLARSLGCPSDAGQDIDQADWAIKQTDPEGYIRRKPWVKRQRGQQSMID